MIQIPGYDPDRYRVSRDGSVWSYSLRSGWKQLKGSITAQGRRVVRLRKDGKHKDWYVHHLVWRAFIGPVAKRMRIEHVDGVYTNCALKNLRIHRNLPKARSPSACEYDTMFRRYLRGRAEDADLREPFRMTRDKFRWRLEAWLQALNWRRHALGVWCASNGLIALHHHVLDVYIQDMREHVDLGGKLHRVDRLMLEAWMCRRLKRREKVRHLDLDPLNNAITNIAVLANDGGLRRFDDDGKKYKIKY